MNIAVDIDGIITIETSGHDFENRTPNKENIQKINDLYWKGNNIVLFTSRNIMDKAVTLTWLENNDVMFNDIIFNKPLYDILIDDKAQNNFNNI